LITLSKIIEYYSFFFQSYRTLARWRERGAFSFNHIQVPDSSTISLNESQSSNDQIHNTSSDSKYDVLSTSECETCSCSSFSDNIKYQTSVKTKQATVQQSNLPELANINCVEPLSSISTEIVCCGSTNDKETI